MEVCNVKGRGPSVLMIAAVMAFPLVVLLGVGAVVLARRTRYWWQTRRWGTVPKAWLREHR